MQKTTSRLISFLALVAIFLTGCGGGGTKNKLIGTWEYKEPSLGLTITLEFTKDQLTLTVPGQDAITAKYTYVNDTTVKVKNPDTGTDEEASFSINGDKLKFDFGGLPVEFTKK